MKLNLVEIPSGTFWMGSPEGKGNADENPYHQVTVKGFRMSKYPITQAQWRTVAMSPKVEIDLNLTPSFYRGEDKPVDQVTWHEAQEFCARLSRLTGENYRLPSEAEWEYAYRAGAEDYTKYHFGDDASQLDNYGWYGKYWEWCQDVWHKNYNGAPNDGSAWLTGGDQNRRALRGGSWVDNDRNCRSAFRGWVKADGSNLNVGFRVVVA